MAKTVTIVNPDCGASVSVTVNIEPSEEPVFRNTAMAGVLRMGEPLNPALPYLTYLAIDGACWSGVFYARRLLGVSGLNVELLSYSFSGQVENAAPFAMAIRIACTGQPESQPVSEGVLKGWREAS